MMTKTIVSQRFSETCDGHVDLTDVSFTEAEFISAVLEWTERAQRQPIPLKSLNLRGADIGNEGLAALATTVQQGQLKQLEVLDIGKTQVGDKGLITLLEAAQQGGLQSLERLSLGDTPVGNHGLIALADLVRRVPLTNFKTLNLAKSKIGNDGLVALARAARDGALASLEQLSLVFTDVGDEGVIALANAAREKPFEKLALLDLGSTKVSDKGLLALSEASLQRGVPCLAVLCLDHTNVHAVASAVLRSQVASEVFSAVLQGVHLQLVRIAFLGMGGVGKSSLFTRTFLDQVIDETNPQGITHDIELIRSEELKWKPTISANTSQQSLTLNTRVWDFSGQWVLHGVHEEFLDNDGRTLFLLVLAANRVAQGELDANGREAGNRLEYWLKTIDRFAGRDAPVVIAVTKNDVYDHGQNAGARVRKIDSPLFEDDARPLHQWTNENLSARMGNTHIELVDNCSAMDPGRSITPLRDAITRSLTALPALQKARVSRHLSTLITLVESRLSDRAYVFVKDYREWCHSIGSVEPSVQDANLRILHHLGIAFYFSRTQTEQRNIDSQDRGPHGVLDVPHGLTFRSRRQGNGLLSTRILNPRWLKWPLYEITRQSESTPYIAHSEISELIKRTHQTPNSTSHAFTVPDDEATNTIVAVLCYSELTLFLEQQGKYFFPRGLSANGKQLLPDWAQQHASRSASITRARLKWHFFPESSFHRLIVHWYSRISDSKVWRYGLVVAYEGCQAVVIADPERSIITIDLHGGKLQSQRTLYHALRRDLVENYIGSEPIESTTPDFHEAPHNQLHHQQTAHMEGELPEDDKHRLDQLISVLTRYMFPDDHDRRQFLEYLFLETLKKHTPLERTCYRACYIYKHILHKMLISDTNDPTYESIVEEMNECIDRDHCSESFCLWQLFGPKWTYTKNTKLTREAFRKTARRAEGKLGYAAFHPANPWYRGKAESGSMGPIDQHGRPFDDD